MAYTVIDKPSDYFNTVIWSGDGVDGRAITTGFQTDWTWVKRRNATNSHIISDIVRGATYKLDSSETTAQVNNYDGGHLESFTSTGFTLGAGSVNSGHTNATGGTYVSWNWKAGGTASSNTAGDIDSSVSANTTAGFSVVSWTADGGNATTVGHGLGSTPKIVIYKDKAVGTWYVLYTFVDGSQDYLVLNGTNASAGLDSATYGTATSTTISNIGFTNGNGMIAYCFAEKKGYSKFSSYIGNGNADGTFVYTGFKPAFVLLKQSTSTTQWFMLDNKRNTYNVVNDRLRPDTSDAGSTSLDFMDFTSNGFKMRGTYNGYNVSGGTYIYMAFAESPFTTSTGIPGTAR